MEKTTNTAIENGALIAGGAVALGAGGLKLYKWLRR